MDENGGNPHHSGNAEPPREVRLHDDLTVSFHEAGRGLPIVFIPGWTMTGRMFSKNLHALSREYRVIAFDPRSHGRSTATATDNNYYQHGRDLAELLDALAIEECILIGWSMGGITAYSYLEQYGTRRVRGLVSVDVCPKPVRTRQDEWGIGPLEQVRRIQASVTSPDQSVFIRRYAGNDYLTAPAGADFVDFIASESMNTPATTAALLLADGNLCDYTEVASEADRQVPILHVVSEKAETPAADWLTRNMPNSNMRALGAHMMFWEFPDEFNQCVTEFVRGISTAAGQSLWQSADKGPPHSAGTQR